MSKKHKKTKSPIMESADEYQTIKLNKKPKMVIPIHQSDKV